MAAITAVCYSHEQRKNYRRIAHAMHSGIVASGDASTLVRHIAYRPAHVGVMYGWKLNAVLRRHAHFIYADLGYWGRGEYWRVSIDGWSPVLTMRTGMPSDRLRALGVKVLPEHGGEYALVLGASRKAMRDHGVGYMRWEMEACARLLAFGARVLFRPKPTDREARSIPGTTFARAGTVSDLFAGASIVVAHHSNACLEAVAAGCAVHCCTGIASPRSVPLESWRDPPRVPGREQLLADAAYCQWTLREMHEGVAWQHLRPRFLQ